MITRQLLAALCLWAGCANAQVVSTSAQVASTSATQPRPADPLDPRAAVPTLRHVPSFAGYLRYAEQPVGDWRDANEATRRAGGWRAYAREIGPNTPADRPRP